MKEIIEVLNQPITDMTIGLFIILAIILMLIGANIATMIWFNR